MKSLPDKAPVQQQRAAAAPLPEHGDGGGSMQLDDRRSETAAQRKLQQSMLGSKQVQQLQAWQHQVDAVQLQTAEQGIVQLKAEATVKQELRGGGILSNFAGNFINAHVGLGANNNISACKIHAARANPPLRNTVVMDPRQLKTDLEAGGWVSGASRWSVSTATGNIALQDTVRLNAAINAPPAGPVAFARTGLGGDAGNFTVENNTITDIVGATQAEVQAAVTASGAYPHSKGSDKKRDYRKKLVTHIREQRQQVADDALVAWVKAEFASIGGTDMHGNANITTVAHINAVASRNKNVEVYIGKDSGNIYHFHREF